MECNKTQYFPALDKYDSPIGNTWSGCGHFMSQRQPKTHIRRPSPGKNETPEFYWMSNLPFSSHTAAGCWPTFLFISLFLLGLSVGLEHRERKGKWEQEMSFCICHNWAWADLGSYLKLIFSWGHFWGSPCWDSGDVLTPLSWLLPPSPCTHPTLLESHCPF